MAYEKQTWQTGDVVTAQKLNHMEDGIADLSDLFFVINKTEDEVTGDVRYIAEKSISEYEALPPFALLNSYGNLFVFECNGNYYIRFYCNPIDSPNLAVTILKHDSEDDTGLYFVCRDWVGNIELTEETGEDE